MKTILIADDEKALRKALVEKFNSDDYKVLQAENGQEVLDVVKNEKVDLILLDIMMPVKDGITVLKELNAADGPAPQILVLTNRDDADTISQMIMNKAFNYLIKADHSLDDIAQKARQLLGVA